MKFLRDSNSAAAPGGRRSVILGAALLLLGAALWTASLPAQPPRETIAAEAIAKLLPEKKTLRNATETEFLSAVCAAARKPRADVAAITQAAVLARRELAEEVVGMVLRCAGKTKCETTGAIVAAAHAAEGDATRITDAAIAKAPNCAETIDAAIQRGTKRPEAKSTGEAEPSPGTSNGRDYGFDPHEPLELVCAGGTQRAVRSSQLEEFLKTNPGSFPGPCQSSPQTNR
ncbi:MAG: hypothetical protein H0W43_03610 [Chthoniobacterales bacterium]|nr:hypothetical protein [Chthoniobacterales bacterium]